MNPTPPTIDTPERREAVARLVQAAIIHYEDNDDVTLQSVITNAADRILALLAASSGEREKALEEILNIGMVPATPPYTDFDLGWDAAIKEYHRRIRALEPTSATDAVSSQEHFMTLAKAVKSILPIGDVRKPDSAVFPIYVRMSELRALHELAVQPPTPATVEEPKV